MIGFVDLHTHGITNYDTRTDNYEDILKIAKLHKKAGTAAILPTIYPSSIAGMRSNMEAVKKAMQAQSSKSSKYSDIKDHSPLTLGRFDTKSDHAVILGLHIEGPFLNPLRCGALNRRYFIKPSISAFKRLIEDYEDIIRIITIAPEMPGALQIIEKCREIGIKVNMGHSDATYEQALNGKKAGATGITHIFNAMRPFHHRDPGLAGLGLLDSELYIEVIADGVHLHPRILELIFSKKRLDKIMIVSDSVKGGKGGPVYKKDILAGSGITLSDSACVLKELGIPDGEISESAIDNPKRYLITL